MKQLRNQTLKIEIKNSQKKITINKKKIAYLAKQILKIKGLRHTELSILFVAKSRMRQLNKKFRKIEKPTDVLAFSMDDPDLLGDVVICPEIAQRFAKIYKTTTKREICLYLIHGILHLLGYNDTNARNRSLMEKEQARILKKITNHGKAKYYSKF